MRHRNMMRCVGVAAATLLPTAFGVTPPSFAAVNWSLVSSEAIAAAQEALVAPIGCACVDQSGSGECPFFECGCACDLTAGACDAFCCCDSECSSDHVASIRAQGLCVNSEPAKPSIEYCSTELTLAGVASSGVNPLLADSVLCVAVDNNEVVGEYLDMPKEQSMTVASAFLRNPKLYSFGSSGDPAPPSSTPRKTVYAPGDRIPVFASNSQLAVPGPHLMGWDQAIGSSKCTHRNPVRFGIDWTTSTCIQDVVAVEGACEAGGSVLDPLAIAGNLLVAANPSAESPDAASAVLIAVEVELSELDVVTGVVSKVATPFPSYYPQPELTNTSAASSTCRGALVGVEFTIYHNGEGVIERVVAAITIGTLTAPSGQPVALSQSFGVRFLSTATISRSLTSGNLVTYERSGNPGYQLHLPVRVGKLVTNTAVSDASTISEMLGGLSLPGLGDCHSNSLVGTPVLFGEDMFLTCTLPLNASSFQSFCERESPVVDEAVRVLFTHVASFGNSDPFLADEWLAIEYDEPSTSVAAFTDTTKPGTVELTCSDVITSLHLEFLVAPVGPINDPQSKIVAARASHAKDTWSFWKNPQDASKTETFLLSTTVGFVTVQTEELSQWIPPTPPVWFSIPRDVFYPFVMSGVARGVDASLWTLVLSLWTALAMSVD